MSLNFNSILQQVILGFLVCCGLFITRLEAVEPDTRLYDKNIEIRETAYTAKADQLKDRIARSEEGKQKQAYLIQQQLLNKLVELHDKVEIPSEDGTMHELSNQRAFSWQDFAEFLQKYIHVIEQLKFSHENMESTRKQKQEFHNLLTALPEGSEEEPILQLQYAYQVRKLSHLIELDKHLKGRLEKTNDHYAQMLHRVTIKEKMLASQEKQVSEAEKKYKDLSEQKTIAAPADNAAIEAQEDLLAGFLGQELGEEVEKKMNYQQLKLMDLQVNQLAEKSDLFAAEISYLKEQQKFIWLELFHNMGNYFTIIDVSGDIKKRIEKLVKEVNKAQENKHSFEKEFSSLRGGGALIGPKSNTLIDSLDSRLGDTFTVLSGIRKQAETLKIKADLLEKAIDLKQSSLRSVVTKTREATDDLYERVMQILKHPIVSYSGMNLTPLLFLQIILLLCLAIFINRLYGHVVIKMGRKRGWTERTVQLVHAVGKYPFIFLVAMMILSVIGINTSSLALVAGALSVGIGFGMQTIVNNLVSGIILLFDKSIRPGDVISLGDHAQAGGYRGNVVQMNIRATVLRTNDNINIIIPNADLMASQVVNWTYSDEKIRFRVPFSVAYGSDIDRVKKVIKETVLNLPVVLAHPEPQIWMSAHGESSLSFFAAVWVEGQNARRPARTFDIVLTEIYKSLNEHGIEMPFPQMDVRLRGGAEDYLGPAKVTDTLESANFAQANI